jgi:hypothetical protein
MRGGTAADVAHANKKNVVGFHGSGRIHSAISKNHSSDAPEASTVIAAAPWRMGTGAAGQ